MDLPTPAPRNGPATPGLTPGTRGADRPILVTSTRPPRGVIGQRDRIRRSRLALSAVATLAMLAYTAMPRAGALAAQEDAPPDLGQPAGELVDRVVAIVGDTAILLSELRQNFLQLEAAGESVPAEFSQDWYEAARVMIDRATDRLLLLQQAKRIPDLTVEESRIDAYTQQLYDNARSQFQTDEEMQQSVESSGMNMFQYRQMLRGEARAEVLLGFYESTLAQSGNLPPVVVTEEEIREFFDQSVSGEMRPGTITFNQLLVTPIPSPDARDSAVAKLRAADEDLNAGDDFEVVARRYSEDPGTRDQGGSLGWLKRTDVVQSFADATWSARPGRPVGPIRTPFGLHIIQVDEIRNEERLVRHILIRPEIREENIVEASEHARLLADSLRGGAEARLLQRDPAVLEEEMLYEDVIVSQIGARLGPEYQQALAGAKAGDVVEPFAVSRTGDPMYVILQVLEERAEGAYDLEEFRDQIRQRIRLDKQMQAYLEELRRDAYIRVLL